MGEAGEAASQPLLLGDKAYSQMTVQVRVFSQKSGVLEVQVMALDTRDLACVKALEKALSNRNGAALEWVERVMVRDKHSLAAYAMVQGMEPSRRSCASVVQETELSQRNCASAVPGNVPFQHNYSSVVRESEIWEHSCSTAV